LTEWAGRGKVCGAVFRGDNRMQFEIRALRGDGGAVSMVTLVVEALNEADARAQLAAQSLRAVAVRRAGWRLDLLAHRHGQFSVLLFSQEFLALIEAGLSVMEALETLCEQASAPRYQSVVTSLCTAVAQGNSLSRALEQSGLFPPLYIGLVRAAESTSNLPQALGRFIDYQTRMDALRSRLVTSAIYPAILLGAGVAVSLFLMTYVVPRFATVYQGSGRPLPWMSALLLDWGRFVSDHAWTVAAAAAGGCILALVAVLRLRQAGGVSVLLAHVPGLGNRVRTYALSRLYMTLGMLLEGGIAAVPALVMSRETVFGLQRQALDAATRQVQAGESLSVAFASQGLSAPVANRFLRVGERSGNLGVMLMRSANYYDADIARWVERFTRVFEPLLMAIIGLVVGLIVILLYMPIFDLAGSLQ